MLANNFGKFEQLVPGLEWYDWRQPKPYTGELTSRLRILTTYKCAVHYENTPIQIYRKFHLQK